jgi:hypothetical protein
MFALYSSSLLLVSVLTVTTMPGNDTHFVDASPATPGAAATLLADASCHWLSEAAIPNQKMTDGLQRIWAMPPDAAGARVQPFGAGASSASSQGKLAAALLIAVANERAGKRDLALGEYRQLAVDGKNTPFGISAAFRAIVLDGQSVTEKLSALPAADGWFLMSGTWTWTNGRDAALAESPYGSAFCCLLMFLAMCAYWAGLRRTWWVWVIYTLWLLTVGSAGVGFVGVVATVLMLIWAWGD